MYDCSSSQVRLAYKFTGKERDSESNLDYFGARYNSSSIGRYMSPGPVLVSRQLTDPQTLNKYSYVFNRPTVLVDPDGEWPGWYHHQLIEWNFGFLGQHAVGVLEAASDWVDSEQAGNQAPERSYMHAMRDGAHNQSVQEAELLSNNYIGSELNAAVTAQLAYEANGGTGYSDDALTHFGHALHTVTDSTSPEHAGYQPWYCYYCISAVEHWHTEENSARSSNGRDMEARYEAGVQARRVWQRYQAQLQAERKKREEERKKKRKPPAQQGEPQPHDYTSL